MHIKAGVLQLPIQRNILSGRCGARNDKLFAKRRPTRRRFAKITIIQRTNERQNESITIVIILAVVPRGPTLLFAHLHQHVVPVLDPGRAGLIQEQTLSPMVAPVKTQPVFVKLHYGSSGGGHPNM